MQLTAESRRRWWLVMGATWLACAALILLHASAVDEYVALLNRAGEREGAEPGTPLRQIIPSRHADAQMWVRLALSAEERGVARVRFTDADNAPFGREVHWSSAFMASLRAAGALQGAVTGESLPLAMEHVLRWYNALLFFVLIVMVSSWAGRRAGAGGGVLVALGMIGHNRFYEGFAPMNVDHHGVVNVAVLGLLLGGAFMGAGWWKPPGASGSLLPASPERARRAALLSALCGAAGLWLSAAAVLPVIGLMGAAGLAAVWWTGRKARSAGAFFEPGIWRHWGRVGASASFAFYLIEYAPSHFSLRLEVNHPLYALAWWGGAELVAILGVWRPAGSGTKPSGVNWPLVRGAILLVAPVVVIAVAGSAAFAISDPFVGELRHFVAEGKSLAEVGREFGFGAIAYPLASVGILLPAAILLRSAGSEARIVAGFLTAVTFALVAMSFWEMRWWLNCSAAQIALMLGLVAAASLGHRRGAWWRVGCIGGGLLLPAAIHRIATDRSANRIMAVSAADLLQPLYRDIAAALRRSQPGGDLVLLADPNASSGISYFGRFKSLGTLYWENASGLRAAAMLWCARTDAEAAALIRARGVTHLVVIPAANFVGEYFRLLHPKSPPVEARQTFGYRLLEGRAFPPWLQPIPYRPPAELTDAARSVALFKVAFQQSEDEQSYFAALAKVAAGEAEVGEEILATALLRAPADARPALLESAGAAFYQYGADAVAVRIYRRRLQLGFDAASANALAWILATSSDATLRDGRAAIALVETMAAGRPADAALLSTLAASYAEVGRFDEAAAVADRALVRAAGDKPAEKVLQQRLETYRARRPWRQ